MKKVIEELQLNINQNKVVVTCSCGVDSMTLLHVVEMALPAENIIVAHVNHNKRVESALEQEYIRKYCLEHNLKLEILELPKDCEGNFQEWARNKRYDFFVNVAKIHNAKYLLLGHHADDNLETIIMRMLKTSSLKGYAGIEKYSKINDINIIRPFLYIPKEEIIKYSIDNNIKYFEDSSNSEDDYTRNRIRHHVIPLLLEENPNLYSAIKMYSETIFSANKLLEKVKVEFIENKVSVNNNDISFKIEDLLALEEDIRIHVLFRILRPFNLSRVCLDNIYKQIISNKNNIVTSINNELSMIKEYKQIIFTTKSLEKIDYYLEINSDGTYELTNGNKLIVDKNIYHFVAPNQTIWYNIKSLPVIIRNRRNGDKIKLKSGTKSVSDYLTNKKVPYLQRKDILVICDKFDNVLHILGYVTR